MADLSAFACCTGGPMAGSHAALVMPIDMAVAGVGKHLATSYELPPRQRRDAIHEAAHAGVTIAVGGVVFSAEIEPMLAVRRAGGLSPASCVVIALAAEAATAWAC